MKFEHEVIFCIVNAGFSDAVMDAAKEFGARGGTVIHARGTANSEAEKMFGITIQPEKEIVMMELADGGIIELFANGGDEFSVNGKWAHFAMSTADVDGMYEKAIAAGATSLIAPKTVPLDSKPVLASIHIAFVKGPDGEEVEFFQRVK